MATLAQSFDPKRNSFNALRLLAAVTVLFSHSYPLSGSPYEPFMFRLGQYDTGGGGAVSVFFIISGFLITRSAEKREWGDYLLSRLLRIVPALAAVIVLQTLLLGPALTSLPLAAYAGQAVDAFYGVLVFPVRSALPGVFADAPIPLVNGSLWTLPVEASFYVLTALFVAFGVMTRLGSMAVALGLLIGYGWLRATGWDWDNQGTLLVEGVTTYAAVRLGAFFYLGAVFWKWRDHIPMSGALALLMLLILCIARGPIVKVLAYPVCFSYLVLFLGQLKTFDLAPWIGKVDISYGVYLYAFPVQQIVLSGLHPGVWAHTITLIALPITVLCAVASWFLIEAPSLRLKNRLNTRRRWPLGLDRLKVPATTITELPGAIESFSDGKRSG